MADGQKPIVPVRFPPTMAAAARQIAERDNVGLSAWIRRVVEREIAARDGRCPTCGHATQPEREDPS